MNHNFVHGLTTHEGTAVACNTCHGTPMQPKFLDTWASQPE